MGDSGAEFEFELEEAIVGFRVIAVTVVLVMVGVGWLRDGNEVVRAACDTVSLTGVFTVFSADKGNVTGCLVNGRSFDSYSSFL